MRQILIHVPFYLAAIICTVLICRMCIKPEQTPLVAPGISQTERRSDSAMNAAIAHELRSIDYRNSRDSAMKVLKERRKKDAKKQINNFTHSTRLAWNDSVLRANGLR